MGGNGILRKLAACGQKIIAIVCSLLNDAVEQIGTDSAVIVCFYYVHN
jgi:hypothetical protein